MGKFIIVLGMILLFSSIGCAQEEKIQDPKVWDFGKIKEGRVFKHEFMIKNDADKVLNIKEVNTSCGCTISEIEKKVLAPQESTKVKVEFKSKGYSGKVQQFIYLNTDNVDEPIIRLAIKAEVEK